MSMVCTLRAGLSNAARRTGYNRGMEDETTRIYDALGGDAPFYALVDAFYHHVEQEPVLRSLYPDDLTHAKEHLALFLVQRFGGHTAYDQQRGHPRLRMRHMPFRIGIAEHDAWLRCMDAALDETPAFAPFRAVIDRYFRDSARFLINSDSVPAITFTQ